MSSLQRSRSLRKPALPSAEPAAKDSKLDPRNGSPSRLPVKPLARSASTATAPTTSTGLRTRLASGLLGRTASTRQAGTAQEPVKREASRYPPSTTTTRPPVTTRPTSSGGPASQARRAPTHTRAKSTTTAANASTVQRPPSQGQSRPGSTTATRPPHARSASVDKAPAPPTQPLTQAQARLRPTFSTLQQHYSPAKTHAPKALTSTFLAPPSPSKLPANVAASAEVTRLQTELLQLHLLHRDAAAVDAQWRESAREKLQTRFAQLGRVGEDVGGRERAGVERGNVLALRSWAAGGGLEERIQALDAVVNGLWTLSESGGRYARVVRRFERWIDRVGEVEDARRDGAAMLQGQDALFIGELDESWKDECSGLIRRLDTWRRQLREIGQVPDEDGSERSSLARMTEGSRSLINDMLEELHVMEEIEEEAIAREDEWIGRMNREDDGDDTPSAGAIWRAV